MKTNLSEDVKAASKTLISKYHNFITHCNQLAGVTLINLEIPFYSIQHWNRKHGGVDLDEYQRQGKILTDIIINVNRRLGEINQMLSNILSPKFVAIINNWKSKGKECQHTLQSSLFTDGIHPIQLLARAEKTVYYDVCGLLLICQNYSEAPFVSYRSWYPFLC